MIRGFLAGLSALAILAISPAYASPQPESCAEAASFIKGFAPAVPPRPVPEEPFVVDEKNLGTLKDYHGRGVVLNFWATWCPPCIREMPSFSRLQQILEAEGGRTTVVTLSQDRGGLPVVHTFFKAQKIDNLTPFIDNRSRLGARFRVTGLPATIIINAEGVEVGRVSGALEWDAPEVLDMIRACTYPASD